MAMLLEETPNTINSIKSTDLAEASTILKKAIADAAKLSKQTDMTKKLTFETRADAQDEANRHNYAYQATIGANEGAAEAITNKVGSDITDSVLCNTDGNNNKGVDEWTLFQVINAAKQGAICPGTGNILMQVVAKMSFNFYFCKKVATNMEQLKTKVSRIISMVSPMTGTNTTCQH